MVLRAFAAHPKRRRTPPARRAARLLASRFFQPDVYASYQSADYWVKFRHPFWWNHLVAAMDSISLIGLPAADPDIRSALDWFTENQQRDGLWRLSNDRKSNAQPHGAQEMQYWISLAICRIPGRFDRRN